MSIEKVEQLVLGKAREEAEALLEQAQRHAKARLEQTEARLRQHNQEELERHRRQLEEEADRELAARTTEHNRELLAQRNRLLQQVHEQAQVHVAQRPQPQYRQWLGHQLRQLTDVERGEVLCRSDDRELIGQILAELAAEGIELKLTLASGELGASGGLIVSCPEYDVNVTLESQLGMLWQEMLPQVAGRLFGRGDGRER